MQQWKTPPVIKVYEALGAIADGRVKIADENRATVLSSDGTKAYDVFWDFEKCAIMANDNGSYWIGYLGYPSIAILMMKEKLSFDTGIAHLFSGIPWKIMNQKHKNDFEKTMEDIFQEMTLERRGAVEAFGQKVLKEIVVMRFEKLRKRVRPPVEK